VGLADIKSLLSKE